MVDLDRQFGRAACTPASRRIIDREEAKMTRRFSVGDHVTWNSAAGQVSGKIIKVHTINVKCD